MAPAGETEIGSYFVATYPPFSVWRGEKVETEALPALNTPPQPGVPLGLLSPYPVLPEALPLAISASTPTRTQMRSGAISTS
jgi:hypothetical protein